MSYNLTVLKAGLLGMRVSYFNELDEELVYIDTVTFDPVKTILTSTWTFYKRTGRDLVYLDEVSLKLRVYTLHELVKITENSGWQFINAYRDVTTLTPYKPLLSGLNVVFKVR